MRNDFQKRHQIIAQNCLSYFRSVLLLFTKFCENEKRSKHFLKLTFLLIFQIKSYFKFLSKWVKVKMNMEEKKLQTKQKSNTRKIQLQVNLCQSHSFFNASLFPKYFIFTNFDYSHLSCRSIKRAGFN